jgi:hypothetical protein
MKFGIKDCLLVLTFNSVVGKDIDTPFFLEYRLLDGTLSNFRYEREIFIPAGVTQIIGNSSLVIKNIHLLRYSLNNLREGNLL